MNSTQEMISILAKSFKIDLSGNLGSQNHFFVTIATIKVDTHVR